MIITRSPLRISLGGGGTDLPSYYRNYGSGFLIAATINKYVYITINRTFEEDIILKYSKLERVTNVDDIQHPIIRETFKLFDNHEGLELSVMADIPAGTGLGSSGSFTTALLKAMHVQKRQMIHQHDLAELACHIEIDKLGEPIGKQDQYAAVYGGLTCFEFTPDDQVKVWPLKISDETLFALEDNLLLFFTGYSRRAGSILLEQDSKSKESDFQMIENLHVVKEIGLKSKDALESGNLTEFASLMNEHWQHKKQRSASMSNDYINHWYELALKNGAIGGKLIGAGGGGFLMFYTEDKERLCSAMRGIGLKEVRFKFDFEGTKVVTQS